ncbi:MAG: amino acid adenylation domain-containing protein, partial [bacterium]|nr:amino acid adenylation domain-containing protein [bacterium]
DATLFMVLLTLFNLFLARLSGQEDIIVGCPIAGRRHADLESIIGMFVNTLALRNFPNGAKTFSTFLKEVKANTLAALQNQDFPFEDLVEKVEVVRNAGRNPLFDAMFILQNTGDNRKEEGTEIYGGAGDDSPASAESAPFTPHMNTGIAKFDLTLAAIPGPQLNFTLEYSTRLFTRHTVERWFGYFRNLLSYVIFEPGPEVRLCDIEMMTGAEKRKILVEFNDTAVVPGDKLIVQLFEEQAERTPGNIALIMPQGPPQDATRTVLSPAGTGDNIWLDYRNVDENVGRLASLLTAEGVQSGDIVGIMLERSPAMVISLLATLKAGAAYLPIEPTLPDERIRYMLQDSNACLLLTTRDTAEKIDYAGTRLYLDPLHTAPPAASPIPVTPHFDSRGATDTASSPAYIIYTSGSTGRPKGVLVGNTSVINFLNAMQDAYPLGEDDAYLLKTSYSFDVSVSEFFGWFPGGGRLAILPKGGEKDPLKIVAIIGAAKVTHVNFVPSMFSVFLGVLKEYRGTGGREVLPETLRNIFLAGEALSPGLVSDFRRLGTSIVLENLYGPTEATVYASRFSLEQWREGEAVPIGRPLQNVRLYILDKYRHVQPIGVAGELCISGAGLALGYLNNPQLTAEKFISSYNKIFLADSNITSLEKEPHADSDDISSAVKGEYKPRHAEWEAGGKEASVGEALYRTGDLACWRADGNIIFLGRIDQQVKIRGFRIELGEIETRIMTLEGIKETVVLDRRSETGDKYLCCWYVLSKTAVPPCEPTDIRAHLGRSMPDYMIPLHFISLDALPLTPSGKIDRRALPEPDTPFRASSYVPPSNEKEEILAGIWQEVLGIERISVEDNFFELGGDSIKAIQVAARLKKHGFLMSIDQLFLNSVIRLLAQSIRKTERTISQETVSGQVKLTPIQHWFFSENFSRENHFNQAVMIYSETGFNREWLEQVLTRLTKHHDALRMVFRREGDTVVQENRDTQGRLFDLEIFNLQQKTNPRPDIETAVALIQAGIDPAEGPLLKIGLFKTASGDHLLLAIHHLVVDGLSWRILLEDIETAYTQLQQGEDIHLPEKTDSFKYWSQCLHNYADGNRVLKELSYWKRIEAEAVEPFPIDREAESRYLKQEYLENITLNLSKEETEDLLTKVNWAYNTEINDVLLSALGMALGQWTGLDRVALNLEGHGREPIISGIDISRTVGWFTSQYPVLLDLTHTKDISLLLRHVKETLRRIPHKGIGYGILRYLTPQTKLGDMESRLSPDTSFNYLGEFGGQGKQDKHPDEFGGQRTQDTDGDLGDGGFISLSDFGSGDNLSPHMEQRYLLDINGMIMDARLSLSITYNPNQYETENIQRLADLYLSGLQTVIRHCKEQTKKQRTPSDLGRPDLSLEEFDTVVNHVVEHIGSDTEISLLYPLSPMQSGMLYHSLGSHSGHVYFEQSTFNLEGDIDADLLHKSFNLLFKKYDILRTVFLYEQLGQPLQVVPADREPSMLYEDISGKDKKECDAFLEDFKLRDREIGFRIDCDPLMRIALFKVADSTYTLVWSFHHILMDGWCLQIIFRQLATNYRLLLQGSEAEQEPATPYINYIRWLEERDNISDIATWKDYLTGCEDITVLPFETEKRKEEGYRLEEFHLQLDEQLSAAISTVAGNLKVTANTLFQTAWGILLQRYNNRNDAVFGTVVSGRPSEIEGIEHMVGLFINTVPLRVKRENEGDVAALVWKVHRETSAMKSYESIPLADIQSASYLKGRLIHHIMAFENFPLEQQLKTETPPRGEGAPPREEGIPPSGGNFTVEGIDSFEQTNYDFNIVIYPGRRFNLKLSFNSLVFDNCDIRKITGHLDTLLRQMVAAPPVLLRQLSIVTGEEKRRLLENFNDTDADYPHDKTFVELFEARVDEAPFARAVVFKDNTLTYGALNTVADNLAVHLCRKGVLPGAIAAVMVERSLDMPTAILAVLKTGAAYLPIDPSYPGQRVEYMLTDSSASLLLTQDACLESHHVESGSFKDRFNTLVINNTLFDTAAKDDVPAGTNAPVTGEDTGIFAAGPGITRPHDAAYVVYTSGTTGRPKGVVVSHRSLVNLCCWHNRCYDVQPRDHALKYAGFGFDASVWEIFPYLAKGASIHILQHDLLLNIDAVNHYCKQEDITIGFLPTRFCEQFMELDNTSLRILLTGGDKLNRFLPTPYRLVNNYGPTENTVVATAFPVEVHYDNIPIGKPIDNTRVYVLSSADLQLQPVGVIGELCIGGDSLATGYLQQPEQTARSFVPNPLESGKTMYRTGDMARWLPDGNIEFFGRSDQQVKIRGYRIELAEIETALSGIEEITGAFVMERAGEGGAHYLIAYLTADQRVRIPDDTDLREQLAQSLPEYMIPAYFMRVETIPLTPNGKIDRRALPEPETRFHAGDYIPPSNEKEEILTGIWQEVLGLERISVEDNFFEVGGDSIKAIQVAARLKKYGFLMTIDQLFSNPVIRLLAQSIGKIERVISQETVSGEVPLIPIQHWFFNKNFSGENHFNQTVMIYSETGFNRQWVEQVFTRIIMHHDALRMVFRRKGDTVVQENRDTQCRLFDLEVFDFREKDDPRSRIETAANLIQAGIETAEGPLVKIGLFKTASGDHLLSVIHHLVVDGVSWRILMEDIELAYTQLQQGKEIQLPGKTDSFKYWSQCLETYADENRLLK